MKKVKLLLKKYGFSLFLLIAEVVCIVVIFVRLADIAAFLWGLVLLDSLLVFLSIVNTDENPEYKIPWIVIVLLPPLGTLLYVMFSKRNPSRREKRRTNQLHRKWMEQIKRDDSLLTELKHLDIHAGGMAQALLQDDPCAEIFDSTSSVYYPSGEEMYIQMLHDLKRAEKFIFLEYFIIEEGEMWNGILDLLKERAGFGVEVRLLYDDIGCMSTLSGNYDKKMKTFGIQCRKFNPFRPSASPVHNNRDHRKIMIIDGMTGYTGGINLADEYINRKERFGYWKDTGIRLEGNAVAGLTRLFLTNWDLVNKEVCDFDPYIIRNDEKTYNGGYYIPFGSGPAPMYKSQSGKNAILNLICQATKYIYITTPYLIIDYDLTTALQNAASRGVNVRIITPHIPDKRLVWLMTRSFYPALLEKGVEIYEYEPGFIHAKNLIVDDKYAITGTINLDYRSLVHHYEDGIWMYKTDVIQQMKKDFCRTKEESLAIREDLIQMTWLQRLALYCMRLFAPMF